MTDNADLIEKARQWEQDGGVPPLVTQLADALERSEALVRDARAFGERWVARAEKSEAEVGRFREALRVQTEETRRVAIAGPSHLTQLQLDAVAAERDRLRAQVQAVRALADGGLEVAMLGTTDGGLIDPDSDVPAGEVYRLAHEAIRAALDTGSDQ